MALGVQLVRNRIGDSTLFSDELLMEIFKASKNNPKTYLENCEKLSKIAVQSDRNRVKFIDVKRHLGGC